MLNSCRIDSCFKEIVGNKVVCTGIIVLRQIIFIEMSSYRMYRASGPIMLITETNFMHTILCILNHVLIIDPTRFGIH